MKDKSDLLETRNARITSTTLGNHDRGFFTFSLGLDYGDTRQTCGGLVLDSWDKANSKRTGWKFGIDLIARILEVVGVDNWEDLKGKHIRVKCTWSSVDAIGNLLKDDWLNFSEFAEARKEEAKDEKAKGVHSGADGAAAGEA